MTKTTDLIGEEVPLFVWQKQHELAIMRITLAKKHLERLLENAESYHAANKTYKAIKFWEALRDEASEHIR